MIESVIKSIPILSDIPRSKLKLAPLSGLTNINYLVSTSDKKYVLRIPKYLSNNNINREQEAFNSQIVQEIGLCPTTLFRQKNTDNEITGVSLTKYIENSKAFSTTQNRSFANDDTSFKLVAQSLVTLQSSNTIFSGLFDSHRIKELLKEYFEQCSKDKQQALLDDYQATLKLLKNIKDNRSAVASHVDLINENILVDDNRVWLIDWEYSAMASPFWDIATICNSNYFDKEKERQFLELVLEKVEKQDHDSLRNYKKIVKTLGLCWEAAFVKETSIKGIPDKDVPVKDTLNQ